MKTTVCIEVTLEIEFDETWQDGCALGQVRNDAQSRATTEINNLLGSSMHGPKFRYTSKRVKYVAIHGEKKDG